MLQINHLTLNIVDEDLLRDVSLSLEGKANNRIAIVGKNGCGKSSFLKTIIGEIEPSAGEINIFHERIAYLPQEPQLGNFVLVGEYLESLIEEPWHNYKIDIALGKVGLSQDYLIAEITHLSGGEKVKVVLAALLLDDPTILIMDEPTNNLDHEGITWLENFISNFKGTILIVSHDRSLIKNVMTEIWEIDSQNKCIHKSGRGYEQFLEERKHRYQRLLTQYEREQVEIDEIKAWLKANEMHPKYRFGALVMSQKQKLEHALKNHIPKPEPDPEIEPYLLPKADINLILKVDIVRKQFGERVLFQNLQFSIHRQEKVIIQGKNGAGKSTLLNMIAEIDNEYEGTITLGQRVKLAYLPQHSQLNGKQGVLETFMAETNMPETQARATLARYLFPAYFIDNTVSKLSFGERKRLDRKNTKRVKIKNKGTIKLKDQRLYSYHSAKPESVELTNRNNVIQDDLTIAPKTETEMHIFAICHNIDIDHCPKVFVCWLTCNESLHH